MDIETTPHNAGLSFFNSYRFIHFLTMSVGFFLIGIVVLGRMKKGEQGLIFSLICIAYSFTLFTMCIPNANVFACAPAFFAAQHILNLLMYFFSAALVLHFFLLFPLKRRFLEPSTLPVLVFYALNTLAAVMFNLYLIDRLVLFYYCLSFITIIHAFIFFREPIERQQMKWVAAGFILGLGPWMCINGIPLLLTGRYLISDQIPATFLICIPLFTAFAIGKYRLFHIDTLFEGAFVYALTIVLLVIIDLGFMAMLGTNIGRSLSIGPTGKGLLSILLVASLYAPLRHEAGLILKRLFRRNIIEEGQVVRSYTESASGQPPDAIIRLLEETIMAHYRPANLIRLRQDGGIPDGLLRLMSSPNEPVRLWEQDRLSGDHYKDILIGLPLSRDGVIRQVILIGTPSSGKIYSLHDLVVLSSLLRQANILYENALLYEEKMDRTRALLYEEKKNVSERERMLKDIHDGIGGITTNIGMLAEIGKNLLSLPDMRKTFSTISELSREGLSDIRTFLHALEDKEATWEMLAADLRHFGKNMLEPHEIRFSMETLTDGAGTAPERYHSLIIFRIYKEALANIIKHAQAKDVRITFVVNGEGIFLEIYDNGVGFREAASKGRGIMNMKKRAEEIGGILSVANENGTRIGLTVPLPLKYPVEAMENKGDVR